MAEAPYQIPEAMNHLRTEIETYYRTLPRLLEEEEVGRHVVIRGTTIHGVWDTFRDAVQYGHITFGDRNFLAQDIDPRYLEPLVRIFDPAAAGAVA